MTLPVGHSSYEDYFNESLQFLKNHEFLFNYQNTEILTNGNLKKIKSWMSSEGYHEFFEKLSRLTPEYSKNDAAKVTRKKGQSMKKSHEIEMLADFISRECENSKLCRVIDFGSGVGYLSSLLNEKFHFKVIGVESDLENVNRARTYLEKHSDSPNKEVYYEHHFISPSSELFLNKIVQEHFGDDADYLICGLHACADLTVDSIRLFLALERCRAMVVMPCCFHLMKRKSAEAGNDDAKNGRETFANMPASESMRRVYDALDGAAFMRRPFLRMACQSVFGEKTACDGRVFSLLSRAVLELYAKNENLELVKIRRKVSNKGNTFDSFLSETVHKGYRVKHKGSGTAAADAAQLNYEAEEGCAVCDEGNRDKQKETSYQLVDGVALRTLWDALEPLDFEAARALVACQDRLQPLCENVVALDRVAYLRQLSGERGVELERAGVEKLVDERVSPRCFAVVAAKRSRATSGDRKEDGDNAF